MASPYQNVIDIVKNFEDKNNPIAVHEIAKKIAQEIIKYPDERRQVSAWEMIVYSYFALPGVSVFENVAVDWISAAAVEVFTKKEQHEYLAKAIITYESNCKGNGREQIIRKILS